MNNLHSRLLTEVRLAKTAHANHQNNDLIDWLKLDEWFTQSEKI